MMKATIVEVYVIFFFNDTATTEIYTLSLHDALPICGNIGAEGCRFRRHAGRGARHARRHTLGHHGRGHDGPRRSEEHTSELQSPCNIVCRLLLEKKSEIKLKSIVKRRLIVYKRKFTW